MKTPKLKTRANSLDSNIVQNVIELNEYRLPNNISDIDLVIDIGAHIGAFTWYAIEHGAKFVVAIEADSANVRLAQENLAYFLKQERVQLIEAAVWRSDHIVKIAFPSNYPMHNGVINTGGKSILDTRTSTTVSTVKLDDLLLEYAQSKVLVKFDCEGSEWPILFTSRQLNRVYAICGEYHQFPEQHLLNAPEYIQGSELHYSVACLENFLCQQGFKCKFIANESSDKNGMFWATRPG